MVQYGPVASSEPGSRQAEIRELINIEGTYITHQWETVEGAKHQLLLIPNKGNAGSLSGRPGRLLADFFLLLLLTLFGLSNS
jgi:hypothetical protein